jgi:hypothetical protein
MSRTAESCSRCLNSSCPSTSWSCRKPSDVPVSSSWQSNTSCVLEGWLLVVAALEPLLPTEGGLAGCWPGALLRGLVLWGARCRNHASAVSSCSSRW